MKTGVDSTLYKRGISRNKKRERKSFIKKIRRQSQKNRK